MAESFDVFRYTSYILSRGQWIAISCVVAVALALAVSLAIERQYTAITQIVIEPPAGSDLRAAMTVSPIYLESLKTYEHFAAGDQLFQKATSEFQLRAHFGARPIESIKQRVLRVGIVRNTRILEIAVTLPDAAKALALARYLAQATVDLNRTMVVEGDLDLVEGIARQERDARASRSAVDAAWARMLAEEPLDALQAAMSQAGNVRSTVQQQMQSTELEIADSDERQKHLTAAQQLDARQEAADASARLEEMRKQLQAIDRQNAEREKLLALRMAHRDKLEADRKDTQAALASLETRLRETRGEAGYRGDRLKIIDPGVVPERPSSPNLPLNAAAALLLGLALPILYLTVAMSYQEQREGGGRTAFHAVAKGRDG
jgi:capsular polysaccharide biosynthesis protein